MNDTDGTKGIGSEIVRRKLHERKLRKVILETGTTTNMKTQEERTANN